MHVLSSVHRNSPHWIARSNLVPQTKRSRPSRDESVWLPRYHPAWPDPSGPLIPPTAAQYTAIGCPYNGGPPERTTNPGVAQAFTRRLRSELQRVPSWQGFQSLTPPPYRLSPAYSSPSLPLPPKFDRSILNFEFFVKWLCPDFTRLSGSAKSSQLICFKK